MTTAAEEHRIIVRHERTGPRTYCYCGWASKLGGSYDEMVAALYAHLGHSTEPGGRSGRARAAGTVLMGYVEHPDAKWPDAVTPGTPAAREAMRRAKIRDAAIDVRREQLHAEREARDEARGQPHTGGTEVLS